MATIIVPEMTLDEINNMVTPEWAAKVWKHILRELPNTSTDNWNEELNAKDEYQAYYVGRVMEKAASEWGFVSMENQEALLDMLNESLEEEPRKAVLCNMDDLVAEGSVIGLIGHTLQSALMLSASRCRSIPGFDCWEFHNYWPAVVIVWRFLRTGKWLDSDGH